MRNIKLYLWFVKESQSYMKGSMNLILVFFISLYKGLWFVKAMKGESYEMF